MRLSPFTGSILLAASAWLTTNAATTDVKPGIITIEIVFPLNDTYAPLDGPLPIVFALSRPDIAAVLKLKVNYRLTLNSDLGDVYGSEQVFNVKSNSLPTTTNSGDGDYAYSVHFSNDLIAGRVGTFRMDVTLDYFVDFPGDADRDIPNAIIGLPITVSHFFTIEPGAQPAIVPGMNSSSSNATNTSMCIPRSPASFYFSFEITDYIEHDGTTYGVISEDYEGWPPECALKVDPDTAATIAAGLVSATATETVSSATASSTATTTSATSAGASGPVPWGVLSTVTEVTLLLFGCVL